jgi:hypothetical protein
MIETDCPVEDEATDCYLPYYSQKVYTVFWGFYTPGWECLQICIEYGGLINGGHGKPDLLGIREDVKDWGAMVTESGGTKCPVTEPLYYCLLLRMALGRRAFYETILGSRLSRECFLGPC